MEQEIPVPACYFLNAGISWLFGLRGSLQLHHGRFERLNLLGNFLSTECCNPIRSKYIETNRFREGKKSGRKKDKV